ncbi:DNA-binding transcription factor yap1 [Mortierella sp. NVP85]|nr:DNA-binding transcription factor yap1 [Mortierella sp. NVP85]
MSLQQHSDSQAVPLAASDWSRILQNNLEAQDLLSTAIAHHGQYREDDPVKRKGAISEAHSKTYQDGDIHGESQLDKDQSSDEVHAPGDGKPAPKKAGRKPLTTEPTNKRKAQNRAAQRAFRDRKERYVKSLEDRIKELEEMSPAQSDSKLQEENSNLKVLVQRLETENYLLKERAFTFDFPVSQPGLYGDAKMKRDAQNNAATTPSSDQSSTPSPASQTIDNVSSKGSVSPAPVSSKPYNSTNTAKTPTRDQLPWSPPSSVGDSVPNSPLDHERLTPERDAVSQTPHSDSAGIVPKFRNSSPSNMALFPNLFDDTINTVSANQTLSAAAQLPIQSKDTFSLYSQTNLPAGSNLLSPFSQLDQFSTTTSPLSTLAGHSPSPLLDTSLFPTDPSLQFATTASGLTISPLMFDPTQALFTNFRDPSGPQDFLASLEDPIEPSTFPDDPIAIGELFNDQLLNYSTTLANLTAVPIQDLGQVPVGQVTPVLTGVPVPEDAQKHELQPLGENEKAIPCTQAWEYLAKHPNFDDADIDDLCTDMKTKAKCSGHGPVIALTDMDNMMNKLNHE